LDDVVVEDRVNLELAAERSDVALEGRELDALDCDRRQVGEALPVDVAGAVQQPAKPR